MKTFIIAMFFCAATAFAQNAAPHTPTEIISDEIHVSGAEDFETTLLDNTSHSFKAVKIIISEGKIVIEKGAKVDFRAGEKIVLKPGFTAKAGSNFHAKIEKVEIPVVAAEAEKPKEFAREGVKSEENIPVRGFKSATILGTYPNPSNGIATIEYEVSGEQPITVEITDAHGRTVAGILKSESHAVGRFTAQFNGADLPSGEYFIMLRTPTHSEALKMVIVK